MNMKMKNFHLCLCLLSNSFIFFVNLDCNSLLLTIQFSDTLTPKVQSAIQKLLLVIFQSGHVLHARLTGKCVSGIRAHCIRPCTFVAILAQATGSKSFGSV